MTESSLTKKLLIKPGNRVLLVNAPDGYAAGLAALPADVTLANAPDGQPYDIVQVFVYSIADLAERADAAIMALKPGGILWFSYPKKTGTIKTDITRDRGWSPVTAHNFEGVTQIAVDDTWSALRFRPRTEIKLMTRKFKQG